MKTAVTLRQVSRDFGRKRVIADVSLTLANGQIGGLLGPSGSGKTTLVKLIAGIDTPTQGTVSVLGAAMPNLQTMRSIGYMTQADALYQELSGLDNLAFLAPYPA